MPAFLAAAMVLQVLGGIYSAKKQAKAMEAEAADLDRQAKERRERVAINNLNIDSEAQQIMGEQTVATAYGGAAVDTGSPLLNIANTASQAATAKANSLREVNFDTNQMMLSANNQRRYSKSLVKASYLGGASSAAEGIYKTNAAMGGSKA